MFRLGSPLGWGEEQITKPERQARYRKLANELLGDSERLQFNGVLDCVVTLSIIREEAKTALIMQDEGRGQQAEGQPKSVDAGKVRETVVKKLPRDMKRRSSA